MHRPSGLSGASATPHYALCHQHTFPGLSPRLRATFRHSRALYLTIRPAGGRLLPSEAGVYRRRCRSFQDIYRGNEWYVPALLPETRVPPPHCSPGSSGLHIEPSRAGGRWKGRSRWYNVPRCRVFLRAGNGLFGWIFRPHRRQVALSWCLIRMNTCVRPLGDP